ncbi:MAG: RraA family protein, partial [Nitrosopumilaceae archaeon]|nr:RraA family protein [Nitrosopumilaceae archaeon]NIU82753.1 RraA family protein [Candidatus Thorarchaeota archaeon]NIV66707.1 RraA family protein [Nitrosopumilaceae archaeon]NIX62660.1 RraA family protein [Nitrosopumilaceae archaeon]
MTTFESEIELQRFLKEKVYSAVVSDVLDEYGYRNQVMRHDIRPIHPDFVVVGRARTAFWVNEYTERENPYENEINLIDSLQQGEVTVHSTDYSYQIATWGELLSTASMLRGSTGAIVDSLTRDIKKIIQIGFPVFSRGIKPTDSKGRGYLLATDVPIMCGDITVNPGEIVLGDYDGVVVIPKQIEKEVIQSCIEKIEGENNTRRELYEGKTLAEVYEKYG